MASSQGRTEVDDMLIAQALFDCRQQIPSQLLLLLPLPGSLFQACRFCFSAKAVLPQL